MTTLVAALVLASALAHASWNAMLKGRRGAPLAASAGLSATWAVFATPLAFAFEAPAPAAYPYLALSVLVHVAYFGLLVRAYGRADLSFVYPIARGVPPLLVALGAWLAVGERPSALAILGVVAIAAGVLTIGLSGRGAAPSMAPAPPDEGSLAEPPPAAASLDARSRGELSAGERSRGELSRGERSSDTRPAPARARPLGLAIAIAVLIAGYTLLDGVGSRAGGTAIGYLLWLTAIQGGLFAAGAALVGGRSLRVEVLARWRVGLVAGVLSAGGYAVALWAMFQAPIALVSALRETSVVFAVLLGARVLGEPLGGRRLLAALVVAAGVILVKLGG